MFDIGSRKWAGLSKVVEETGELNQVIGKLIGNRGEEIHFSGKNLKKELEDELADVLAAITFVIMQNDNLDEVKIGERSSKKFAKFLAWHKENLEK